MVYRRHRPSARAATVPPPRVAWARRDAAATGRDPRFILQYMASLGLDMAVAYNGQYVFTRDEVVFSQPIEKEDIDKMIAYAEKFQRDL